MNKTGLLLINIGSPTSYQPADVARYLRTFLMDEDIITIPFPLRWFLVHAVIVPRRAAHSAANYRRIWIEGEGSPLTVFSERFARRLQMVLGENYLVKLGMRYSTPSIQQALTEFANRGIRNIVVAPLYPQYAEATSGSSLKEVQRQVAHLALNFQLKVLPPFFHHQEFIENSAEKIRQQTSTTTIDHYLFSFHGLPVSQIKRNKGCLVEPQCCEKVDACANRCYRAHCLATARQIAKALQLEAHQWSLSFQSRLGRGEWLQPSTDDTIKELALRGHKTIAVACPSFVVDCIETLEEIAIGGAETFKNHGGENFIMVPCLNDSPEWTKSFAQIILSVSK